MLKYSFKELTDAIIFGWPRWSICFTDDDGFVPIVVTPILSSFLLIWSTKSYYSSDLYLPKEQHDNCYTWSMIRLSFRIKWDHPDFCGLKMLCFVLLEYILMAYFCLIVYLFYYYIMLVMRNTTATNFGSITVYNEDNFKIHVWYFDC